MMSRFFSRKHTLVLVGLVAVIAVVVTSFLFIIPSVSAKSTTCYSICIRGYNYVNPSTNYHYASTSDYYPNAWGEHCSTVFVAIWDHGVIAEGGCGFAGCFGLWQAKKKQETDGHVAVSYTGSLYEPCSHHQGWGNETQRSTMVGAGFDY